VYVYILIVLFNSISLVHKFYQIMLLWRHVYFLDRYQLVKCGVQYVYRFS